MSKIAALSDRRAQFELNLECGHSVVGAGGAHAKRCRTCRRQFKVVSRGEMVRPQINHDPVYKTRPLGAGMMLMVATWEDIGFSQYLWWCRHCNIPKMTASTLDDAVSACQDHGSSEPHQDKLRTKALIGRVADILAAGDDTRGV